MDKYLKISGDVMSYGHCIIKEELIISDIDEEVDADKFDEPIDKIPTKGNFSTQSQRKSGGASNKNVNGGNKVQTTLDRFIKSENAERNQVKSENSDDVTNDDEKANAVVKITESGLDKLVIKLAKAYCKKCEIESPVRRRKARCRRCKAQLSYSCKPCEKTYTAFTDLRYHVRDKHTPQRPCCHPCSQCGKTFARQKSLREHVKFVHPAKTSSDLVAECPKCGKQFEKTYDFKRKHEKVCEKAATYECKQCPFTARYKSNLTSHVSEKHSNYKAECKHCAKTFTNKRSLRRHETVYCNKSKSLECHHCGHRVFRKDQMVIHIQQVHSEAFRSSRPNSNDKARGNKRARKAAKGSSRRTCEYCDVTLNRYEHMRFHLERCDLAPRSPNTVRQPSIDAALKNLCKAFCSRCNTEGPVEARVRRCDACEMLLKFFCESCSKTFSESHSLREHLRTRHLENQLFYRCDQCRCSYNRMKNLLLHKKACHSDEPSTIIHKCSKCGKGYKNYSSYRGHKVACQQEPKYYCDKCPYKTHFKSSIIDHLRAKRATCI